MSFIKRMLNKVSGRSFDPEQMAEDLFSGKAEKRRIKENQETDEIIQKAIENSSVQKLMAETGITEDHIRDVYRRLMLHGDKQMAIRAINDVELVRWYYFNGGKEMFLSQNQAIELFMFAKNGK